MKAIITGAKGQLGRALVRGAPDGVEVVGMSSAMLDICDRAAVDRALEELRPELIINAAAYTQVDKAESESDLAYAVNCEGVENLARAAKETGARLIQVSTDFVFDGRQAHPYAPEDTPSPINVYGASKLAGEQAAGEDALIVRTSWVYGADGHNFVKTMLRLMAERDELRIVDDQIGTPTQTSSLAKAIWQLGLAGEKGIWHYSDSGAASWYDFAVAIMEEALAAGLVARAIPILPIPGSDYPAPAQRPHYSVLDRHKSYRALGWIPPHWREQLRTTLRAIKSHG